MKILATAPDGRMIDAVLTPGPPRPTRLEALMAHVTMGVMTINEARFSIARHERRTLRGLAQRAGVAVMETVVTDEAAAPRGPLHPLSRGGRAA